MIRQVKHGAAARTFAGSAGASRRNGSLTLT
jgi:hypothetical protein